MAVCGMPLPISIGPLFSKPCRLIRSTSPLILKRTEWSTASTILMKWLLNERVIISEREGSENDPLFKLEEAMQMAAFKTHPYRNEVIGSIEDLRAIQRNDLYKHYQTYYNPANAVISVVGDFKTVEMLEKIRSSL